MTPEQLHFAGQALWGYGWQTELAKARGINRRTVRHWAAGRNAPPADLADFLLDQMAARRARLKESARTFRQMLNQRAPAEQASPTRTRP